MSSSADVAPLLLALDTATDRIHAALVHGASIQVLDLPGGAQASVHLLPALSGLLADVGKAWPDIDAIAFGRGPGAFTGLRTACSVTQGLALALSRPVIAIDTLMAVAEQARLLDVGAWSVGDEVWVLQDARMDELYVGAFQWRGDEWQAVAAPQLWPVAEPLHRWAQDGQLTNPGLRWVGNALRAYPERLAPLAPAQVGTTVAVPGGDALASLALRAWARGHTLDAALALPLYVRDKVAQTTAERMAAKEVASAAVPANRA